jgi:O-antigen ligase
MGMMAGLLRTAKWPTSHSWAVLLIVAAFLLGGGARGDIQSLIVLRPLSVIVAAIALWSVTTGDFRRYPFLTGFAASLVLIAGAHLIPLPPAIWQGLPGRDLVAQIDLATGQGAVWRPFSMVPEGARNGFMALFVPLGLFLLLIEMPQQQALRLGLFFLAMGLLSAFIGLLQAAGLEINLYRIDTPNSGLFSNHNHHAVVLAALLPLIAYYASERSPVGAIDPSRRMGLALLSAAFVVPAVLVAGSRAGLAALLLSLISAPFVYAAGRRAKRVGRIARYRLWIAGAALVLVGGFISWLFALSGQNAGVERMFERDLADEARWPAWRTTVELVGQYFPWGSGNGSFVEVYQIAEHSSQLGPAYMNHAHNDWIEVALTAGLPGIVLLATALLALALTARRLVWGLTPMELRAPAAAGVIIICLFGLASIVDYPVRVPSVSCFLVYAAYLAHFAWRSARPSDTMNVASPAG